jgi:hypothetical protein
MRIAAALLAFVATGSALGGCSGLQPYPTNPADPLPGETDAGPRVAICYNTLVSTLDQVQVAAQQECVPNTEAAPLRTDWRLQFCPLLLPARATFVCTPKK